MYGVRIIIDGEIADLKIFSSLPAAQERFEQGRSQAYDGEFESIVIFNVPEAKSVRDAAEAIRFGDRNRIRPVKIQESQDRMLSKLSKKIRIDL